MNKKQIAAKFLPPFVLDFVEKTKRNRDLQQFLSGGKVPWSKGYYIYRTHFLMNSLENHQLLKCIRSKVQLPPGYGVGVDERCIEYLWLFAHLDDGSGLILDAGSTLNHDFILDQAILRQKFIHILTLAPEGNCFWHKGISYLFGDLRDIPIRDGYYDTIACISTLEHVGFDNTYFSESQVHKEHRTEDFLLAMRELGRVLKSGGSLLLTVPFGAHHCYETFQQFDRKILHQAVEAFGKASEVEETFFRYTPSGWEEAIAEECADCEYAEWAAKAWEQKEWPESLPVEADRAAAARAVACVRLIKA